MKDVSKRDRSRSSTPATIRRGTAMLGLVGLAAGITWAAGCGGSTDSSVIQTSGAGAGTTTSSTSSTSTSSSSSSGQGGASPCGPGTTFCNGSCTVTDLDPANCGACGKACAAGEVCSKGTCNLDCVGGTTKCGDKCVDTSGDTANCGACGKTCAVGEVCSAGTCGLDCVGGTTKCGDACVDTTNDPANCGACATPCANGELCSGGKCAALCNGGTTQCGMTCVDTNADPANCGGCGTVCQAGQVCSQGACGLMCFGGTTACNGFCVDTKTDPANCGACGAPCGVNQVCSAGACASICGGSLTKCGNNCTDTQTDPLNCGGCGTVCAAGAKCTAGACVQCDSNTTDCDGDGWLVSEGDCCDKPGPCGAEPAKVNPGAIEVVGNGVDDNCNGLTDLFDSQDTIACDNGLASNSAVPGDYAKAIGICRTTTANPPKAMKTWGLISAALQRADGSPLADMRAVSIRSNLGGSILPTNGTKMMVMSSGIASDATQTLPGPNGGAPNGGNVSTTHTPASAVDISTCGAATCIKDWFTTANPPLKNANELPTAPNCGLGSAGTPNVTNDSSMLVLTIRAPTNAKAFSFNSFFISAEYAEYVCSNYNDQFLALVDTPNGVPSPIANPIDKNLMTYSQAGQKWPIGINIAKGTSLFSVCQTQAQNPGCWSANVSNLSCSLGAGALTGTGFEKPTAGTCTIGGGTYWLTTAGNVIPGDTVQVRVAIWDVGDTAFDSLALVDGFQWLSNATLPGTN